MLSRGCQAKDERCWGHIEREHVVTRAAGGYDYGNEVGLCLAHHAMRHKRGIKTFCERYGDMKARAEALRDEFEEGDWAT